MNIKELGTHLMKEGQRYRANDLYILPVEKGYRIIFRRGNTQFLPMTVGEDDGKQLILFFKYMADMDVSEKRRGQMGAANVVLSGVTQAVRIRLSTVADFKNRESLVIRFLGFFTEESPYRLFFPAQWQGLSINVKKRGLYLFCGPTGSGKTSTMYRLVKEIVKDSEQVICIEDPVEIEVANFLQLQVNEKIGMTYDSLIAVCLRHRPDVLIVGEIRDSETARAVIRSALTGHMVFSTVHARSKHHVIERLVELGVTRNEISQCLEGVVYQRLLPIYCPYCGEQSCKKGCLGKGEGAIFDTLFGEELLAEEDFKTWRHTLQKAWAYGFISKTNYDQEAL